MFSEDSKCKGPEVRKLSASWKRQQGSQEGPGGE